MCDFFFCIFLWFGSGRRKKAFQNLKFKNKNDEIEPRGYFSTEFCALLEYCKDNNRYKTIDEMSRIITQNTINASKAQQTPQTMSTLRYNLKLVP